MSSRVDRPGQAIWNIIRDSAFSAWRGPDWLESTTAGDGCAGGPRILSLFSRSVVASGDPPILESRSVYFAFDSVQAGGAALRLMRWDGKESYTASNTEGAAFRLQFPLTCVLTDDQKVFRWLAMLGGVRVQIQATLESVAPELPTRGLLLVIDSRSSRIEFWWPVAEMESRSELDVAWQAIWAEMGEEASRTVSIASTATESYWSFDFPTMPFGYNFPDRQMRRSE